MDHLQRNRKWGHPLGQGLRKTDYASEAKLIAELLQKNFNHPGVKQGLSFFDTWFKKSSIGLGPCPDFIYRLFCLGVTPLELLIEACGVWLYSERSLLYRQGIIPIRSDTHRVCVLGQRIIVYKSGVTNTGRIRIKVYRETGEHIRDNIGILMTNIARSIINRENEKYQMKTKMAEPLEM